MRKRISALLMAVVMCAALAVPAWADGSNISEPTITWLSVEGTPSDYCEDFGWVMLNTGQMSIDENSSMTVTCLVDMQTGERIPDFDWIGGLSEGFYAVKKWEGSTVKAGFVDRDLNVVVPLEYIWTGNFSDGLAVIETGTLQNPQYGYINKKGDVVIPAEYDRAYAFSDGVAIVAKENEYGKLKWGLIDKKGQIVAPFEYEVIGSGWEVDFSEQLVPVRKITVDGEGKYGFINAKGVMELPIEFDAATSFSDGLAVVGKKDGNWDMKYGCINRKGEVVIPMEYDRIDMVPDNIWGFDQGLILVNQRDSDGNDCYGYADRNGEIVIPPQYVDAGAFSKVGLAYVAILEGEDDYQTWKHGYIDKTGNVVIPMEYSSTEHFYCDAAAVAKWDDNGNAVWGLIDKTGTVILPLEYERIYTMDDGLFQVCKKSADGSLKYGIYDSSGKEIVPVQFDRTGYGKYTGLIQVIENDDAGFYNTAGELILPTEYDAASVLGSIGWVKKETRCGIFENPYWNPPEEVQTGSKEAIPVVPIVAGVVLVAGVATGGVLVMRKKGKRADSVSPDTEVQR